MTMISSESAATILFLSGNVHLLASASGSYSEIIAPLPLKIFSESSLFVLGYILSIPEPKTAQVMPPAARAPS